MTEQADTACFENESTMSPLPPSKSLKEVLTMIGKSVLLMLLLLPSISIGHGEEDMVDGGPFTIDVPRGFKVSKESPVEDFELIRVSKGDKVLLTIYVGNQPNFPIIKEGKTKLRKSRLGNVDVVSMWDGYQLKRKEMRIALSVQGWPMALHVFSAANLSMDEVMIAEKIMASINIKKK